MGPLRGIRIVEMAGVGPGPMAGMIFSDMGAEVVRIDRTSGGMTMGGIPQDICNRGRRSIAVDLKQPEGIDVVLKIVETADAIFEVFRPGIMEKLGLGPEACLKRNPRIVYGRMTGWGQDGPLSQAAGHDINYIAITGVLNGIGEKKSRPVPPMNLIGDYGGGTMFLVSGVLAALLEAKTSGKGQVVDAAIVDGVIVLNAGTQTYMHMGMWNDERGSNLLDGGSHFYDTYECADGQWISVGAVEDPFYSLLMEKLELEPGPIDIASRTNPSVWPEYKDKIATKFKTKTRDEWCEILEGTDACFSPVMKMSDAHNHPHNKARGNFIRRENVVQAAPAPRFSRTQSEVTLSPVAPGADTDSLLSDIGLSEADISELREKGAIK